MSSPARSARRTPTGEPGGGGRATEGTGAVPPATSGRAGRCRPASRSPRTPPSTSRRSTGPAGSPTSGSPPTPTTGARLLLRARWDGAEAPAVEVPVGDFFGQGWGRFAQLSSSMIAVNPHGGFNCYWPMPFREGAHLTLDQPVGVPDRRLLPGDLRDRRRRVGERLPARALAAVQPGGARACTRSSTGCAGMGQYVGHLPRLGRQLPRLVGRGRDEVLPRRRRRTSRPSAAPAPRTTSAAPGTSTCPARATPRSRRPTWACTRSSGRTGSTTASCGSACTAGTCPTRSGSPRRCGSTVQALGWRAGGRYLPLHDDLASTALFYLDRPTATRPPTPELDDLEQL